MQTPSAVQTGAIQLILQAGPIVKLVLLFLFMSSVVCWTIIFAKWISLKKAARQDGQFLDSFWAGKSIDEVFIKTEIYPASPVAAVFQSGYKELRKLTGADGQTNSPAGIENISRALARTSNAQVTQLEHNINWLATTASAAPFVGLFGTVWGIMTSFQNIGASGSANLAVVAPGISEALIATAAGLAAAIPAAIAYNHFVGRIRRIAVDIDCFSQDLLNILQRNLSSPKLEAK